MNAGLIVIAKEPVPGRVKTRLCPPYSLGQAADLARAALLDTLDAVAASSSTSRTLCLAGRPGPWTPPGFTVIGQRGDGLDERLAAAFDDAYRGRPLVLIGMDTPQVAPGMLDAAGLLLKDHDAVFGPAADGGFWLLGLTFPDPSLLHGVPMSRACTGHVVLRRLHRKGLSVALLPELTDVDTAADVAAVAALAPGGRFAATAAALGRRRSVA